MNPEAYDLLAHLGAGRDGSGFRAKRVSDGRLVELRLLTGARDDSVHWARLSRRIKLAYLLEAPGARKVLEHDLHADPPSLSLDWIDAVPLSEALKGRLPMVPAEGLKLACDLAAILHAAHRVGLAHGNLTPKTIFVTNTNSPHIDFTGTATREDEPRLQTTALDHFPVDVQALGVVVAWLLSGKTLRPGDPLPGAVPGVVRGMLSDLLTLSASDCTPLGQVETLLRDARKQLHESEALQMTRVSEPTPLTTPSLAPRSLTMLGRFRLEDKLGQGGMGEVFRAIDAMDGTTVAVKTLLPEHASRPKMLQRFLKEARMLAEVNNPHVTNLLEINEDHGVHYLACEFVAGQSVGKLIEDGKPIEESLALAILSDVCRALAPAHARGIVHRDIKPDNILLLSERGKESDTGQVAKLSDFGLARHVVETESLHLTSTGAILGTPLYLSPEQCVGEAVDPRSDVYSAGATLFHLLAGRPPYLADGPLAVMQMHRQAAIPSPKTYASGVSDGACRIVEKALAKSSAHRHADAVELLADIERLRRGEVVSLEVHPKLPKGAPDRVAEYEFTWELESSPAELWPYVANTERLNRAVNLPAAQWSLRRDEQGKLYREGKIRPMGMEMAWEEHPFEWIEGRRFGVLREMTSGPFRWFVSMVELEPRSEGGTKLTHRFKLEPRWFMGKTLANVQMNGQTRRSLDRVYKRIDAVVRGRAGTFADHFEESAKLTRAQQRRLDEGLDKLAAHGVDPLIVERLGAYLATAPAQELTRIRPIALARRLEVDAEAMIAACLFAARDGLLCLLWDLLCPLCRIPSEVKETLKALKDHGRCEACDLDYELDFGQSVELIFRVDPAIREAELGVFCIGGPAHSRHVVAQVRLAAGERMDLQLELTPGAYKLRGPNLPAALELRVEAGPHFSRWDVDLGKLVERKGRLTFLRPGGQVVGLLNPHGQELVVRLERTAQRDDALTAGRAASSALFRELFPGEMLSPGQLVSVANVTLLASEVSGVGQLAEQESEARAFARLHEHLRQAESLARKHGGALVKAVGDGVLAAFSEPARAVEMLLALDDGAKVVVHRGPAMAATINEQLDYFGATVRETLGLLSRPGELLVSAAVMEDPAVSGLLRERGVEAVLCKGAEIVYRLQRPSREALDRTTIGEVVA